MPPNLRMNIEMVRLTIQNKVMQETIFISMNIPYRPNYQLPQFYHKNIIGLWVLTLKA